MPTISLSNILGGGYVSGYSGYSGTAGDSGYSGYSGVGVSGYSGVGASGYSGYSGYSGTGTSGYSGTPVTNIPINSQTSAYILAATDAGDTISITTGGVTVNASVFAAGDAVSIYNNSGSNQTITQGSNVTLRLAGTATTGNRTIAQYGIVTLYCVTGGANPVFVCAGGGLS